MPRSDDRPAWILTAFALGACSSADPTSRGDGGARDASSGGVPAQAGGASGALGGAGSSSPSAGGSVSPSETGGAGGARAAGGADAGSGTGGNTSGAGGRTGGDSGPLGSPGCGRAETAGTTAKTLDVNGMERSYLLVVPPSVGGFTPVPVILGFHGGSGTAEEASQYGLSGDEPALYVYPQAPYWPEVGGVAWNVDPAGVDFPFFDALLVALGQEHCIDASRIFAAGKSNGGFFVNELGCRRSDVLRGIASVAGGGPSTSRCTGGVAAMIVHGAADTTVVIDAGRYSRDYWLAANGCAEAGAPVEPSPCVAYSGCAEPVVWCEHAGAHTFPAFAATGIRGFFLGM